MDDILYAKLPIVFENYEQSLAHYKKVDDDTWFWDTYREVRMLIYAGGATLKQDCKIIEKLIWIGLNMLIKILLIFLNKSFSLVKRVE